MKKYIVIHCTATPQTTTVDSLKSYWKNILGWKNYGYHFVISPNGDVHQLTQLNKIANGVAGHNKESIHIAYIGGIDTDGKPIDSRTEAQKISIKELLHFLRQSQKNAKILGHRDFSKDINKNGKIDSWERIKECPCFDAITEYSDI